MKNEISVAALDDWSLEGAELGGVRPANQARSRLVEEKLLKAGHRLLDARPLDQLSVEEVCALAGCSVGGFYRRFESKDAFFAAIQYLVVRSRDHALNRLAAEIGADWPLLEKCEALAEDLVGWYRANRGVLEASLRPAPGGGNAWAPLIELGNKHKLIWLDLLRDDLDPRLSDEDRALRVAFANQIVNGTIINMLLNDPGPLTLADPRAAGELARILRACLIG